MTTPVLIAVLATIAGVLIVGVGGGLVRPMQSRWERYLDTMSVETQKIRSEARRSPSLADQARATAHKARPSAGSAPHDAHTTREDPTFSPQSGTRAYDDDSTVAWTPEDVHRPSGNH